MTGAIEVIAGGIDHPEAVAWDADRGVVFCGGEAGQLYAVRLDGHVEAVADTGGSLLGLALDEAGIVYACDTGAGAVIAVDPDTGATATISRGAPGRPFVEPNGIAIGPDGSLFVTCSGTWGTDDGVVMRIDVDGRTTVWSTATPHFPNGCLVRDAALLVVESRRAGVLTLPLERPDEAAVVCRMDGCVPDQLAADAAGRLFVGCYRPDLVAVVDPDGVVRDHARDPSGMTLAAPTGVAFAGPGLECLVVANYGARELLRVEVGAAGSPVERAARSPTRLLPR